jgi:uncharacterized protein
VIVFDTTILLYSVGSAHPLRDPCRALIELVAENKLQATTTVEVIQEFAHVHARRRSREDAAKYARGFMGLLQPLVPVDETDLLTGLEIFAPWCRRTRVLVPCRG